MSTRHIFFMTLVMIIKLKQHYQSQYFLVHQILFHTYMIRNYLAMDLKKKNVENKETVVARVVGHEPL